MESETYGRVLLEETGVLQVYRTSDGVQMTQLEQELSQRVVADAQTIKDLRERIEALTRERDALKEKLNVEEYCSQKLERQRDEQREIIAGLKQLLNTGAGFAMLIEQTGTLPKWYHPDGSSVTINGVPEWITACRIALADSGALRAKPADDDGRPSANWDPDRDGDS